MGDELAVVTAERDVLRDMAGHLQMRLSEAHCAEREMRDVLTLEREAVKEIRAERDAAVALVHKQAARITELEDALMVARMRLNLSDGRRGPKFSWEMSDETRKWLQDRVTLGMPCRATE